MVTKEATMEPKGASRDPKASQRHPEGGGGTKRKLHMNCVILRVDNAPWRVLNFDALHQTFLSKQLSLTNSFLQSFCACKAPKRGL